MGNADWVDALAADELPTDDVKGVIVAGRDIAVYTVGAAVTIPDPLPSVPCSTASGGGFARTWSQFQKWNCSAGHHA